MAIQYIDDIQESVKGRRRTALEKVGFFKFDNMTEIMIAGREGSNDPRRQIARRFLDWNDYLVGVAYRICEELNATLDEDLKDFDTYQSQLPDVPPEDDFVETHWSDDRFEVTDTLDIHGGQEDIGEDKRAI